MDVWVTVCTCKHVCLCVCVLCFRVFACEFVRVCQRVHACICLCVCVFPRRGLLLIASWFACVCMCACTSVCVSRLFVAYLQASLQSQRGRQSIHPSLATDEGYDLAHFARVCRMLAALQPFAHRCTFACGLAGTQLHRLRILS